MQNIFDDKALTKSFFYRCFCFHKQLANFSDSVEQDIVCSHCYLCLLGPVDIHSVSVANLETIFTPIFPKTTDNSDLFLTMNLKWEMDNPNSKLSLNDYKMVLFQIQ